MYTPFDWQEAIGHRAQYVESRLIGGLPVVALSASDGIWIATLRRQARKTFEVYDRLAFSALGMQSDIEALRVAAIDYCSREGFQRSERDVTVQRLVAALAQPVKRAFGDFGSTPVVARSLFAEVGMEPAKDRFFVLDYDGDYALRPAPVAVSGREEQVAQLTEALALLGEPSVEAFSELLAPYAPDGEEATVEVALLSRDPHRSRRFRMLAGGQS